MDLAQHTLRGAEHIRGCLRTLAVCSSAVGFEP